MSITSKGEGALGLGRKWFCMSALKRGLQRVIAVYHVLFVHLLNCLEERLKQNKNITRDLNYFDNNDNAPEY